MNTPVNLLDYDRRALEAYFAALGEKSFRAAQVLRWIHHSGCTDFGGMSNLSKALRERLKADCCISAPRILSEQVAADGTHKWLLQVDDNNSIETVFIPERDRGTLCVSSQAGCPLDCSFCATGKQGFSRNLGVAEIIGQLWLANQRLGRDADGRSRVTNVVMMGMGEPLLNYDNVVAALGLMLDDHAYGLSRKRVTVSTAGVVPAMDRLSRETKVCLAVSLHAPSNELRDELVPLNRRYPLEKLLPSCRRYVDARGGEPITFEYVMLDGVNDQPSHARALVRLLGGLPAKINLIPFNPIPRTAYRRSLPEAIERFREILLKAGIMAITRKTRGDDIDAACGQLVGRIAPRARRHQIAQLAAAGPA